MKIKKIIIGVVIALAAIISVINTVVIIPTGYTGVRSTFGQISPDVVPNGFSVKLPFIQNVEKVNNKQQDIRFTSQVWSETAERTAVYFEDVTVTYQISPAKSAWIAANVTNYKDALVSQNLVGSAIKAASKTLNSVDATNRAIIEPAAAKAIQESLDDKYGVDTVIINKVTIGNADFEDSYNQVIAEKQTAQLEYEKQQIENQRKIEAAEAEAKVKLTAAKAEADARLIEADAEAEANRKLEESLTDRILHEMTIEKWDGTLPTVTGSGSGLMLDVSALIEGTETAPTVQPETTPETIE